jgi:hypothetical protein
MKTRLTAILFVLLAIASIGFIMYRRLPPAGVNLTGTWHTPPNMGGSVIELSHSRSGLRGNGYHFRDDGGPGCFNVAGSVSGHVVHLVFTDEPDDHWIVNETNTYVISQSPKWGIYLVNTKWTGSQGTNQSPDWNANTSLYKDWNRLWGEMHNNDLQPTK